MDSRPEVVAGFSIEPGVGTPGVALAETGSRGVWAAEGSDVLECVLGRVDSAAVLVQPATVTKAAVVAAVTTRRATSRVTDSG